MNRLQRLRDAGVSIWLDTLSRDLLDSGAFAELVRDYAVTGATSNPTIFAKAILGSDCYDEQAASGGCGRRPRPAGALLRLRPRGHSPGGGGVAAAYEASAGNDGFVSFECTPDVADDTQATIAQALELWGRLHLPNVLIKVPATTAGVAAIEELTAPGGSTST